MPTTAYPAATASPSTALTQRAAARALAQLKRYYPALAVTGPRQSGKTTLVRAIFADKPYANLEEPDTREFALSDPRGFLGRFPDGAVLDEVQRAPELFSYLQARIDATTPRPREALFILTGSQQLGLTATTSQSLAGRVGYLHLLPFSLAEAQRYPAARSLGTWLATGGYPPIHDRDIPSAVWFRDYVATYVERDVRQLINVRDLATFQRFVRMCASRVSQILNLTALASDCGITHHTAKAWLSILEASYIAFTLQPWHGNIGKRLVKAPKLYFYDTGLAAWLSGQTDANRLEMSSMRGPLFENWLLTEVMKSRFTGLIDAQCHFYRDSNGNEIDLVIDFNGRRAAIEIKSGQTLASDWFDTLSRQASSIDAPTRFIAYGGDRNETRTRATAIAWRHAAAHIEAWLATP
jgi:predicted AAA+ superfamily ATPase